MRLQRQLLPDVRTRLERVIAMTDRTTELLPCPFCGSKNVETSYKDTFSGDFRRGVYCADCCGGIYPYYDTEAEAIAAWNTRATHGTLTAEQVRMAIFKGSVYASYDGAQYYASGIDMQAIADELNAELGSGTCKITATATNNLMYPDYMTKWYELSCGHSLTLKGYEAPKWCAVCGKAVER